MGRVISCGRTKLTVAAGKELHFELGENPTINIALSNPKLMTVGDKVTIHGQAVRIVCPDRDEIRKGPIRPSKNVQANFCEPEEVTVTLVQPLTGPKKPPDPATSDNAEISKKQRGRGAVAGDDKDPAETK